MVDEDRARPHAGESPVGAKRDRPQILVVADAGEDDIAIVSRRARIWRAVAAMLRDPAFGLGDGAIIDLCLVPLGFEMAGHRIAHHA
jgi:hypothetical protein